MTAEIFSPTQEISSQPTDGAEDQANPEKGQVSDLLKIVGKLNAIVDSINSASTETAQNFSATESQDATQRSGTGINAKEPTGSPYKSVSEEVAALQQVIRDLEVAINQRT